ncbi:hypothetical protein GCM10028803_22250 [Larkinella knui]|uniref:DUF4595 domain-containing protein n=1 Tax=Larkinella knui TaxID=2025310 RepID=A0A3P1CVK1_9BACT|nr:hypothetical protein [Larkinella knui]RRB17299.1 hypothetical protein EHT87_03175 [Larkinella knui]
MKTFPRMALFPVGLIVLLDACTLEDHQPSQQNPNCQVLTMTVTNKSSFGPRLNKDELFEVDGQQVMIGKTNSYRYTFDEQGRLSESLFITYTGSTAYVRETLDYETDKITQKIYEFGSSVPSLETIIPLNAQGLLNEPGLVYNAEGYLVEDNRGLNPTKYTIDGNGNLILVENFLSPGGVLNYSQAYEYDLSKPNTPNPAPYRGKTSRNLPTKFVFKTYESNGDVKTATTSENNYLYDYAGHTIRSYNSGKVAGDETISYGVTDYDITCR